MSVYQEMWTMTIRRIGAVRFGDNNRVTFGGAEPGLQADALAMLCHPLCTGVQILAMLRLSGNAWETDIFTELIDEPGLVLLQIINDSLHQDLCSRESPGSKANLGVCQSIDTSPFAQFPFVLVLVLVLVIAPFTLRSPLLHSLALAFQRQRRGFITAWGNALSVAPGIEWKRKSEG